MIAAEEMSLIKFENSVSTARFYFTDEGIEVQKGQHFPNAHRTHQ